MLVHQNSSSVPRFVFAGLACLSRDHRCTFFRMCSFTPSSSGKQFMLKIFEDCRFVNGHSVCWKFGSRDPGFESCIHQSKTTCLLSIRKSLACVRASKLTTNIYIYMYMCAFICIVIQTVSLIRIETFRNAILTGCTGTGTVTVRGVRRLWRHRIVCIWNAPNRWPNRKCQHMTMTVSAADNRTRFTISGYA